MKKLVKFVSLVVVLVMVLAYSLYFNRGSNKQISLDFENSGSFEWSEEVEINNIIDSITLDFENSGSFEWSEEVEIKGFIQKFRRNNDFKNSGLPETIELVKF